MISSAPLYSPQNKLHFTGVQLKELGKTGELPVDSDGYRTHIVGALGVYNASNIFYVLEEARSLFESSTQFMRRVKRHGLLSELGHPERQPGQSLDEFMARYIRIQEDRVCAHISDVWLGDSSMIKDSTNGFAVPILAKLKAQGPFGYVVEEALANKRRNTFWSIRSICDDFFSGGRHNRIIRRIIGFDFVSEPGIVHAEKFRTPGLEHFIEDLEVTQTQFERFLENITAKKLIVAQESYDMAQELLMDFNIRLPKGAAAIVHNWV